MFSYIDKEGVEYGFMEESLLRSRPMSLVQIYLPASIGKTSLQDLLMLKCAQFVDLNIDKGSLERTFVSELRMLDAAERKLEILAREAKQVGILEKEIDRVEAESIVEAVMSSSSSSWIALSPSVSTKSDDGALVPGARVDGVPLSIEELLAHLEQLEERVKRLKGSSIDLIKRKTELIAVSTVLRETSVLFEGFQGINKEVDLDIDLESGTDEYNENLGFVAGTISKSKEATLEAILWRALRGHLYMRFIECDEANNTVSVDETISVFLAGAHGPASLGKIRKLAQSLGSVLVSVEGSVEQRHARAFEATAQLEELLSVQRSAESALRKLLTGLVPFFSLWKGFILKERAVFCTLNRCSTGTDNSHSMAYFVGEAWVPTSEIPGIRVMLERTRFRTKSPVGAMCSVVKPGPDMIPPTVFKLNKVTSGFQALIDAYGVPAYEEINPTLFTIVTLPFMFAVMFGDFGHGIILTLFAILQIRREKIGALIPGELGLYVFEGRYIVLLMGLFSVYIGLLYNDCFSKSLNLFSSSYSEQGQWNGSVVKFGIDRIWIRAENALVFLNGYKMKQAILLGICHMMLGLGLAGINARKKRDRLSFWGIVIPQVVFLGCTFGYLSLLIVWKWISGKDVGLLNTFVDMFLSPGNVSVPLYPGQAMIQVILIIVAVVCVPIMLFAKPFFGEEPFGEEMINSLIHTIEFVLGTISNTASYLRLWALSLAHSQLSEVLWMLVGENACIGPFMAVGIFAIWFTVSVSLLIAMEGLGAFLHSLRLHWVEFNNKFYAGTGVAFEPLSISSILDTNNLCVLSDK